MYFTQEYRPAFLRALLLTHHQPHIKCGINTPQLARQWVWRNVAIPAPYISYVLNVTKTFSFNLQGQFHYCKKNVHPIKLRKSAIMKRDRRWCFRSMQHKYIFNWPDPSKIIFLFLATLERWEKNHPFLTRERREESRCRNVFYPKTFESQSLQTSSLKTV